MYHWNALSILEMIIIFALYSIAAWLCWKAFNKFITLSNKKQFNKYSQAFHDGYRSAKVDHANGYDRSIHLPPANPYQK